jgi:uncharacterized membrane protein YhaH (DUF805 family)
MNWYLAVLKKYVDFSGRARRKEYWFFILFHILIVIGLSIIESVLGLGGEMGYGILTLIYLLAVLVPSLAVTVRRLHDGDRSGFWILIGLVPLIGGIILLVFMVLPGTSGDNRFGPDPLNQPDP